MRSNSLAVIVSRSGSTGERDSRGHRVVDHVSDLIIEAWGPDEASCFAEALIALVDSFTAVSESPTTSLRPLTTSCSGAEDALVALFEEVIFGLEIFSEIPVRFHLQQLESGGFAGDMEVVPAHAAELVGPVPKAVSYHELSVHRGTEGWHCHVLVDL